MASETTKNVHAGHRKRMKQRYLASKQGFSDHEILEMLLYYAIPRSNTNETAHLLLDYFGSLEGVVNADVRELSSIDGVGQNAAMLLSMLGDVIRRIARESCEVPKSYNKTQAIITYIQHLFVGEMVEKLYLLLFDNGLKMLGCVCLSEGIVNLVHVEPRTIMEHTIRYNASAVVLAHNHPNGVAVPSADDIESTKRLRTMLGGLKIELLEHFVFAGDRYLPILNCGDGAPARVENSFYSTYMQRHDAEQDQ